MSTTATTSRQVTLSTAGLKKALAALKAFGNQIDLLRFGVDDGDLYVESAGGQLGSARIFLAEADSDLDVVVSASQLKNVLAGLGSQILISSSPQGLSIADGTRVISLNQTLDDGRFERRVDYDAGTQIAHFGPTAVATLLRAITHAASDQTRPVLCAVRICGAHDAEAACVVTTDSFRLYRGELVGVEDGVDVLIDVLIPSEILYAALKTIAKGDGFDLFSLGDRFVIIDTGTTQWLVQLTDGQYPNYNQLIPAEFLASANVDREKLMKSTLAAGKLLTKNEPLRLRFDLPQAVVVTAIAADVGTVVDAVAWEHDRTYPGVAAKDYSGEGEFWVGVNPKFFADALKALEGDTVTLEWISSSRPLMLSDEFGAWVMIMPIKLQP